MFGSPTVAASITFFSNSWVNFLNYKQLGKYTKNKLRLELEGGISLRPPAPTPILIYWGILSTRRNIYSVTGVTTLLDGYSYELVMYLQHSLCFV